VSSRYNLLTFRKVLFKLPSRDKERSFDICVAEYAQDFFGAARSRSVVECQCNYFFGRINSRNDFAKKLKCSGIADLPERIENNKQNNNRQDNPVVSFSHIKTPRPILLHSFDFRTYQVFLNSGVKSRVNSEARMFIRWKATFPQSPGRKTKINPTSI